MADVGSPSPISSQTAVQMAAQAGFSDTVKVVGTPYTQLQVIVAIAIAESGLDAHAWNPGDPNGGSFGILQINGYWMHPQSGPAISKASMLDPQQAFNYAFQVISHRGTSFGAWSTFSRGLYKNHILNTAASSGKTGFSLPANGWWKFTINGNFGHYPDPDGAYPKPDINIFGLPAGYPIAAILPGTITGFSPGRSYGAVVTVKMDSPINAIATHYAMLHMTRLASGIHIGQHVNPGDILGYAGANIVPAGSTPASLGFAFLPGDDYANGNWFNQYINTPNHVADQRLNPEPFVRAAQSGNITQFASLLNVTIPNSDVTNGGGATGGSTPNTGNSLGGVINNVASVTVKPSDNVTIVLEAIDYALEIINPIPDANSVDQINLPGGATIPNPISWLADFFYNVFVVDFSSIVVRGMIIALGFYIMFKVVNNFINISGAVQNTTKAIEGVAMIAAGA